MKYSGFFYTICYYFFLTHLKGKTMRSRFNICSYDCDSVARTTCHPHEFGIQNVYLDACHLATELLERYRISKFLQNPKDKKMACFKDCSKLHSFSRIGRGGGNSAVLNRVTSL